MRHPLTNCSASSRPRARPASLTTTRAAAVQSGWLTVGGNPLHSVAITSESAVALTAATLGRCAQRGAELQLATDPVARRLMGWPRLQYLVLPPPLVAPLAQSSLIRCFSMVEELVAPL